MALVRRFFEDVCNGRRLNVADELFAEGHTYHDPSSPWVGPGPEGMKHLLSTYHSGFSDAYWNVDEMLDAGDTIVTRWTGTGVHNGDLMGIAPSGKAVSVVGVWIHRLSGKKIEESWNVWDSLGMLQLGLVTPKGQEERRAAW